MIKINNYRDPLLTAMVRTNTTPLVTCLTISSRLTETYNQWQAYEIMISIAYGKCPKFQTLATCQKVLDKQCRKEKQSDQGILSLLL